MGFGGQPPERKSNWSHQGSWQLNRAISVPQYTHWHPGTDDIFHAIVLIS